MTPEQIQAMVKGAVEASGGPAWWVYLLLIFCACVGSYFGSYLGEKGKNNATKEDIAAITEKVEAVKVTLASRGWVKQQHWTNREKHYMELLSHLTVLKNGYDDLFDLFPEPWTTGVPGNEARDEKYEFLHESLKTSRHAVRSKIGPAAVFLSDVAVGTLEKMWADADAFANNAVDLEEYYSMWASNASAAYEIVLSEAKRDLDAAERDSKQLEQHPQ